MVISFMLFQDCDLTFMLSQDADISLQKQTIHILYFSYTKISLLFIVLFVSLPMSGTYLKQRNTNIAEC